MKTKFIPTSFVKENTPIDGNVSSKIIEVSIIKSQNLRIHSILGTILFDKLQSIVDNNEVDNLGNENYKLLLNNYISYAVSEWTFFYLIGDLNYHFTSKSVSKKDSEFSEPSSLEEIKWLKASVKDSAEYYSKRLTEYLCENKDLFPELTAARNSDDIKPFTARRMGGIYIPK